MISFLIKGLIIGVIVSAPIGPIGVLCAQRTLSKGIGHGYATAIGATLSDLFYAIIAVFCMSYVKGFITDHEFTLRLAASLIIFLYGLYTYINNPANKLSKVKPTKDYIQDSLTSFGLTITNPLVILFFMGMFTKLDYIGDSFSLTDNLLAIIFILCGATFWWILLVSVVGRFRGRFNIRGMWILNRGTGIVLMVLAIGMFLFWLIEPLFHLS